MAATLPLLVQHGRSVTTRQIAEAAGVAEGTIFRVFASKEELVQEALNQAFDPAQFLADLRGISLEQPLRDRLVRFTGLVQVRLTKVFALLAAMGLVGPPEHGRTHANQIRGEMELAMIRLVEPDAASLKVPPRELMHLLRLLTFSGSHPHISDDRPLTPEQIVDTILYGATKEN